MRLGPPIPRPGKFIGIGLNYADHAEEASMPIPEMPIVFHKASSCISGPNYSGSPLDKLDYEVEFGFVIGTGGRYITREAAWDHVAGSLVNDVSDGPSRSTAAGCGARASPSTPSARSARW